MLNAAKNGDSKGWNEILRLLKIAVETNLESVAPAAEANNVGRDSAAQMTKTILPAYEVSDVSLSSMHVN